VPAALTAQMALTVMRLTSDRAVNFPTFRCQNNAWFLDSLYPVFIRIVNMGGWTLAFSHRHFYIFVKSDHFLIETQYPMATGGFRFPYTYSRIFPQEVIQPVLDCFTILLKLFEFIFFSCEVKSYTTQLQWIDTVRCFG